MIPPPLFEIFPTEIWELFEFYDPPPSCWENFPSFSAVNFEGSPKLFWGGTPQNNHDAEMSDMEAISLVMGHTTTVFGKQISSSKSSQYI